MIGRIQEILGTDADGLLKHQCKISKDSLHLPGPDFIDRGDRELPSHQQCGRSVDPSSNHELVRGQARAALEEPGEMVGTHVHQPAELTESQLGVQIVLDVLRHMSELGRGEAPHRHAHGPRSVRRRSSPRHVRSS